MSSGTLGVWFNREVRHVNILYTLIFSETTFSMFSCTTKTTFLIFLEHFILLCAADGGGATTTSPGSRSVTVFKVKRRIKNTFNDTTTVCVCVSPLWYIVCFQSWTHSRGWQWPDTRTLLLTGWQLLLSPQTRGLLSRCNEIICYTSSSPEPYAPLAHRLEEELYDLNINKARLAVEICATVLIIDYFFSIGIIRNPVLSPPLWSIFSTDMMSHDPQRIKISDLDDPPSSTSSYWTDYYWICHRHPCSPLRWTVTNSVTP